MRSGWRDARAGPRGEHLAPHRAERHQLLHDGLRSADVPRRQRRQAVHQPLVAVQLIEI